MSKMTESEKSHWRDRIAARIDEVINLTYTSSSPLFAQMSREIHARALASLGLTTAYAEIEAIRAEEADLPRRRQQAHMAMIAGIRSNPLDQVTGTLPGRPDNDRDLPDEVAEAIARGLASHRPSVFNEEPLGRFVMLLEDDKEHLLDTVWLATAPSQIKVLWSHVGKRLGDTRTPLERAAMRLVPLDY